MVIASPAAPSTHRADPDYLIDSWQTEDGLPESSATAIVQTSDGYLWFGTFAGLVRFDGVKFTVLNRANTPELPSHGIVNLHLDRRGRLWVSTYTGLAVREEGQWRQVTSIEGGAADYARTFAERANGDLLVTTFGGKLFEVSGDTVAPLPTPPGEAGQGYFGGVDEDDHWWAVQNRFIGRWEDERWVRMVSPGELSREVVGCAPSRDGGMWLLLGNELRKLHRGRETGRVVLAETPGGIWSLREDSSGNVWIATYDRGVCRVGPDGSLLRWEAANGLSDSGRCIFEDREGNIWAGTSGGGLFRFAPRRFQHFQREGGRQEFLVRSVSADAAGGVWAATYGRGLFRFGDSGFTHVVLPETAGDASVLQSVLVDRAGRLWIGTAGSALWVVEKGVARRVPGERSGGRNVLALFEDSRGRVWISGGGGIAMHDGSDFRGFGPEQGVTGAVIAFAEDVSGRIWLSNSAGVFRQDSGGDFSEVRANAEAIRGIRCLKSDANGSMWLGSADRGLLRWKDGTLDTLDAAAGFPVNRVQSILADGDGFFWMTSLRSIVRARRSDLHAVADGAKARLHCWEFDAGDGLPRAEFSAARQPVSARDDRGRLWFATTRGVAKIDPARLQLNDVPPPVHIEALVYHVRRKHSNTGKLDRRRERADAEPGSLQNASRPAREVEVRLAAPFDMPLRLPAGSRRLEIHYTATSFTVPERVRFETRLQGGSSSHFERAA